MGFTDITQNNGESNGKEHGTCAHIRVYRDVLVEAEKPILYDTTTTISQGI